MAPVFVLDTNIVLDLFVYEDPLMASLRRQLADPATRWIATVAMRTELGRVLGYPQIARRLRARDMPDQAVLDAFDARVETVEPAPKAPYTCKDPDDQGFIDLAAQHGAVLISKDAEVLCMAKRLAKLGVRVSKVWQPGPEAAKVL